MEELKLCPFCDGEARLRRPYIGNAKHGYSFHCTACYVSTKVYETEAEAITAWETRADSWIPVSERLPKDEEQVIATDGKIWYKMRMFGGKLSFSGSHSFDNAVTHWQPINLPQKGEINNEP